MCDKHFSRRKVSLDKPGELCMRWGHVRVQPLAYVVGALARFRVRNSVGCAFSEIGRPGPIEGRG